MSASSTTLRLLLPADPSIPKPRRVLVANRGEIALRIIRSVQETGREAVAVYADQDIDAQFVKAADHAYALDGTSAAETYLDAKKVLDRTIASASDAIHPGYGFLSENAEFAQMVQDAGIEWIGPSPEAINTLGDKVRARKSAVSVGVPPVPGTLDAITERSEVEEFVAQHGYPIVLKAADGGGGRGIHVMRADIDVDQFFLGRDITSGGAGYFVERYVPKARHVETQCGRDKHGNFTVFSSRDCSVQRRHQKMIEEAPAPFLKDETRQKLLDYSKALFDGVGYVGLGTCEYLLSEDGDLFFLEVNPRLQVEHTVTEEVSGVDLVATQLAIAAGEEIEVDHPVRGHSIELRVTSEDPANDLFPTMGVLTRVVWPTGPGIRIDTGIGAGDEVSPEFDSMVAKIIVTAPTREQAIKRALRATKETELEGVSNPLPLYAHILSRPEFASETDGGLGVWTRWLEDGVLEEFGKEYQGVADEHGTAVHPPAERPVRREFVIELDGKRAVLTVPEELLPSAPVTAKPLAPQPLRELRERGRTVASAIADAASRPLDPGQPIRQLRERGRRVVSAIAGGPVITAPMQGIVVRILVEVGAEVAEGDLIMVLEAMKMEKNILAPRAGVLKSIEVKTGQNVSPGHVLATLDTEGAAK